MSEPEEVESKCKSMCNPVGVCLHNVRGTIAKVWVWAGMIGLSISFALLYTYCSGNLNPDKDNCGVIGNYLGWVFDYRNKL